MRVNGINFGVRAGSSSDVKEGGMVVLAACMPQVHRSFVMTLNQVRREQKSGILVSRIILDNEL